MGRPVKVDKIDNSTEVNHFFWLLLPKIPGKTSQSKRPKILILHAWEVVLHHNCFASNFKLLLKADKTSLNYSNSTQTTRCRLRPKKTSMQAAFRSLTCLQIPNVSRVNQLVDHNIFNRVSKISGYSIVNDLRNH